LFFALSAKNKKRNFFAFSAPAVKIGLKRILTPFMFIDLPAPHLILEKQIVTTHVVSPKLFRLKAEGDQKSITAALG
jgi:hypothetical protein